MRRPGATTRPLPAEVVPRPGHGAAFRLALILLAVLTAGCATRPVDPAAGELIARFALGEIGRPYRYGGDDAQRGFDCSGLASAAHARASITIPRTAALQFAGGPRVSRRALEPGDLVFFRFAGKRVDHVGVYIGAGEFVHAPGVGQTVRRASLSTAAFARRYAGAARYWRD